MSVYFYNKGRPSVDDKSLNEKDSIGIRDTDHITIDCETGTEFIIIETPINKK